MSDLVRDAPLGQLIRYLTKNRMYQYPEERADFELPPQYAILRSGSEKKNLGTSSLDADATVPNEGLAVEEVCEDADATSVSEKEDKEELDSQSELAKVQTAKSTRTTHTTALSLTSTRSQMQKTMSRADLEQQFSMATVEKGPSRPIEPERMADGTILVDWYTTDDPENPQNWSFGKKNTVLILILLYTMGVYMGSAIYSPSIPGIMVRFNVNIQEASMGLSLYVLAYGIGPLLFSPVSEIASIGRNPPYLITYAIFVILCVPTSLVNNFAGLIVLRFLQGFFGSPCLATGGATLQDMYSLIKLPYVLSLWAFAATCGPALGPIISGFSVMAEGWRWSMWEMLWMNGPIFIGIFIALPETSAANLLLRRAQRLRKLTGDARFKSQSEIDQASLSPRAVASEALIRPFELIIFDPSIAFTAIYIALVYGIFYSFFEAFPLVYERIYHFNLGTLGLAFLPVTIGVLISIAGYWAYVYYVVEPEIRQHGLGAPERRLIPALVTCWFVPVGLFIFAWTTRADIHWIVSCIAIAIAVIGIFIIFQCIFLYLALSYPQYAASLFAGNDFARSALAAGAIHFSSPLFRNLGVDRGVTILAALTIACAVGCYVLYFMGEKLRAGSRFAAK